MWTIYTRVQKYTRGANLLPGWICGQVNGVWRKYTQEQIYARVQICSRVQIVHMNAPFYDNKMTDIFYMILYII